MEASILVCDNSRQFKKYFKFTLVKNKVRVIGIKYFDLTKAYFELGTLKNVVNFNRKKNFHINPIEPKTGDTINLRQKTFAFERREARNNFSLSRKINCNISLQIHTSNM